MVCTLLPAVSHADGRGLAAISTAIPGGYGNHEEFWTQIRKSEVRNTSRGGKQPARRGAALEPDVNGVWSAAEDHGKEEEDTDAVDLWSVQSAVAAASQAERVTAQSAPCLFKTAQALHVPHAGLECLTRSETVRFGLEGKTMRSTPKEEDQEGGVQ
jgi:hypothetical protein